MADACSSNLAAGFKRIRALNRPLYLNETSTLEHNAPNYSFAKLRFLTLSAIRLIELELGNFFLRPQCLPNTMFSYIVYQESARKVGDTRDLSLVLWKSARYTRTRSNFSNCSYSHKGLSFLYLWTDAMRHRFCSRYDGRSVVPETGMLENDKSAAKRLSSRMGRAEKPIASTICHARRSNETEQTYKSGFIEISPVV